MKKLTLEELELKYNELEKRIEELEKRHEYTDNVYLGGLSEEAQKLITKQTEGSE